MSIPTGRNVVVDVLDAGQCVIVRNDYDPIPLRGQVEAIYAGQFEWSYQEKGPKVFQLQPERHCPNDPPVASKRCIEALHPA